MAPKVPSSTIFTWITIWLQTLIRAVTAIIIFALTTAYLPIRLVLAPCMDCGTCNSAKTAEFSR